MNCQRENVSDFSNDFSSLIFSVRERHFRPPKRPKLLTQRHRVTFNRTRIFNNTAVKTSKLVTLNFIFIPFKYKAFYTHIYSQHSLRLNSVQPSQISSRLKRFKSETSNVAGTSSLLVSWQLYPVLKMSVYSPHNHLKRMVACEGFTGHIQFVPKVRMQWITE